METLSKKWVLILINALFVLIIGLLLIFIPIEVLKTFVFVLGILIAFIGLILVFGVFHYAKKNERMIFWLLQGLFNLVIGGAIMFFPDASIKFLLILGGLWIIVLGVYQLSVGMISNPELKSKGILKLNGLTLIIIGFLLIFVHELIVGIVVQLLGIMLLLLASGMLYFAYILKQMTKAINHIEEEFPFEEVKKEDN